jgi:plastocyanin
MTWHSLIFSKIGSTCYGSRCYGSGRWSPRGYRFFVLWGQALRPAALSWLAGRRYCLMPSVLCLTLHLAAATVTGRVQLKDSRDPAVRSKANYSGIVVSLLPLDKPPVLEPAHATIRQKGKTFLPHILAITAGTLVDFPNDDPIFHNAFSSYNGQIFDLSLYPPHTSRSVLFTRPGVVRVFCNIHASMSAVIVVLKTPYFAVSNRDGTFTIPDVPHGNYELSVFHERATETSLRELDRRVTVADASIDLPPISVSETGYLPAPHSNKYGQPYPPEKDENQVYPGVRN